MAQTTGLTTQVRAEALALLMHDYQFLKDTIEAVEVASDDALKTAGDLRSTADRFCKTIEAKRKEHVDPLNKIVKTINGEFKPITILFEGLLSKLDAKIIPYQREVIAKKQARAEAMRKKELEEIAAKQKVIEAAAYEIESEEILQMAADIDAEKNRLAEQKIVVRKTTAGNESKTTLKKTWHARVIDAAAVPQQFLCPDEKAIKQALSDNKEAIINGTYKIAGVEFYFEETLVSIKS